MAHVKYWWKNGGKTILTFWSVIVNIAVLIFMTGGLITECKTRISAIERDLQQYKTEKAKEQAMLMAEIRAANVNIRKLCWLHKSEPTLAKDFLETTN